MLYETRTDLPRQTRVVKNTWIPLADGTRLAARIWLPLDAEQNPVPGILEYIPYRKNDVYAEGDERRHGYVAAHGYACVRVDLRGSGDSDGLLEDEYLPLEQQDGVEVIAWIEMRHALYASSREAYFKMLVDNNTPNAAR